MKNNYLRHVAYLRNSIAYDHDFWFTIVKWWYLQMFFWFFQNIDFWVVSGVKKQKMAQNDKKFCLLCFISQESYIIWLSLKVHFCEISKHFFHFFKILIFGVFREVKGQKLGPEWEKIMPVALHISRTIHHDFHLWYTYVKW